MALVSKSRTASPDSTVAASEPWLSPTSYWLPEHYVLSAWLEHAPFAFWLMDAARPDTLAELGTHNGFSFYVFAEAAKRLGLPTQIYALDNWEGDDQAGFYSDDIYEGVRAISEHDYPSSTHLVRGFFNASVDSFADNSIDLLHIDGRHGYADVAEDFNLYRPKLTDRAVVIFHDTREYQEGFGVHQFWDELAPTAPSFTFEHGHGLGVLALGKKAPQRVLDFLKRANADPEAVRASYARLGAVVSSTYEMIATLAHQKDLLELDARTIEQREKEIDLLNTAMREIRASTSWRVTAPLRAVTSRARSQR